MSARWLVGWAVTLAVSATWAWNGATIITNYVKPLMATLTAAVNP